MLKGVIFDLDGVLIETEKETFKFYQKKFSEAGLELKDGDFKFKAGRKSHDFFNDVLTKEDRKKIDPEKLLREKRELFNTKIDQYAKKVTGGKKLIEWIYDQGLPMALASQNEPRMIESALKWLGIKQYFQVVLTLDDIKNKKPDPEIYLLALKRLKLKATECIVIEDSQSGVEAARNAGIFCVGIYHDYMPNDSLELVNKIVYSLSEIKFLIRKWNPHGDST